ncbi:hypothetical protein MAPG_06399 [Magnaporthiopsis poae ATCC 64411]|uniref:SET domain-containing protein n=1 Tax=Magnaporthiopsis poae (strain ATCC 64411 / 73-15) TaxID=644358 RepID=A0A0C4E1X5_MAGP6|nr:hypothetical protein MAPG_06399 [Magnaporthiopsis poae ATCC 64411]
MKAAGVIGLCAAAAYAQDTIQNHIPSGDFCRSSALLSQKTLPDLAGSTCSRSHDHYATQYANNNSSSPWTHVGPCLGQQDEKFCVYSSKTFADGRGISIVTRPGRAEQFGTIEPFTNPDLTRHVNRDLDPDYEPVYKSVKVPGKGIGLVAAKTIERGDRIMGNTASVMVDYGVFEALKIDDVMALQAAAVDLLPHRHRALVMNLSTHVDMEMTHHQKVDRLLATNSFDIDDHDPDGDVFYVTFPEISRMNHDCRPNADYYYDPETMTHNVHAVRRINIGEEITVSYIDPMQSHADRIARLNRSWGFPCGCSLCQQKDHVSRESDDRLNQILELRKEFHDYSTASRATPQMGELMVSLYDQERLDLLKYEAHTYAAIEWNGVGEPWLATKHARLAVEHGLPSVGPADNDVIEMQALAKDPYKHWSWMLRTSKRMSWGKKASASE